MRGPGMRGSFQRLAANKSSQAWLVDCVRARQFAVLGEPQRTNLFPGIKRHFEIIVESGKGCEVFTHDGKRYLDATSGIGVLSTGHCHPTVVKAVQEQVGKVAHAAMSCYYNAATNELLARLPSVLPDSLDSLFFSNSGSEAVECALRLARQSTGRDNVVAFLGGYHGRTAGALAVTSSSSSYRGSKAGPLPGGTAWVRYPYEYAGVTAEHALESMDLLLLQQAKACEIAAVLIEPVLGEGGYVVPPAGFLKSLREWCTKHGILLIADEVQSGYGRTGMHWAVEHFDVVPDILVSAKGIASGYPLSMIATRSELTAGQQVNSFGGTYGGNAVACAAALATLDVFEQEGLIANSQARGQQIRNGLQELQTSCPAIGDVRGLGLMVGVEFDREVTGTGFAAKVQEECYRQGMLVLPTGHRETIRLIPPLIISSAETDELLEKFGKAVNKAYATL